MLVIPFNISQELSYNETRQSSTEVDVEFSQLKAVVDAEVAESLKSNTIIKLPDDPLLAQ